MTEYVWNIDKVDTIKFFGGQYDVVSKISWHMTAKAGTLTAEQYGTTDVPTDDLTHFTPYNSVTNEELSRWLEELVDVPWLKSCLDLKIQQMQIPSATTISR